MGILATVSLIAGIWLALHLRDIARTFSGSEDGELVRGPGKRQASRRRVWAAIFVFNAGWIACVVIWIFVIGGDANALTSAAG